MHKSINFKIISIQIDKPASFSYQLAMQKHSSASKLYNKKKKN